MEILEKKSFIQQISPFDKLEQKVLDSLVKRLDIICINQNDIILSKEKNSKYLYFVIKGLVHELDGDDIIDIYHPKQYFSSSSLIENRVKYDFKAITQCICYILPKDIFLSFLYKYEELESYFFQSIAQKINTHISNERNQETLLFMSAKVQDAFLHKPIILDSSASIYDGVVAWGDDNNNALLVKNPSGELGIVTNSDIRKKAIIKKINFCEPLYEIANYNFFTIDSDEFLFIAQILMHKHNIKKLIVKKKKSPDVFALLDMNSIMSFFSSHTYTIDLEIEKAINVDDLKNASLQITNTIKLLFAQGIKIGYISEMISQLNDKLFYKLFELTAPKELKDKCAIIVMGSEGREEQILKTDQDNAIILSDDCDIDEKTLNDFTKQFTKNLCSFGYELCPGNIMLSNPFWCRKITDFKDLIELMVKRRSKEDLLNLAIFYDSKTVCGENAFLETLKEHLYSLTSKNASFCESFSLSALNFPTPLSMFDNLVLDKKEHNELDIKKGAIFPIVHGVRSLCMEKQIKEINTTKRLKEIASLNLFEADLVNELIEALDFLLSLRLKERLRKINGNEEANNYINPKFLGVLELDLLKDSFKIVNKFKRFLSRHYSHDILS